MKKTLIQSVRYSAFGLAVLTVLGVGLSLASPRTQAVATEAKRIRIADGQETHGGKPPKRFQVADGQETHGGKPPKRLLVADGNGQETHGRFA